ncbi:MAG TPA: hypothetical protein VGK58_12615 [Lacipirellulaceae bacterium]
MQLGKTLVGAVIGGLVGAAVCVAITKFTGWDKMWLAILVALLTGIGVRLFVDTRGHASYARGALTAILAVAAYFLSFWASTLITTKGASAREINAQAGVRQAADDDAAGDDAAADDAANGEADDEADGDTEDGEDEAADDAAPAASATTRQRSDPAAGILRPQRPPERSPWEYIALGVAALIAYQLGRGSEGPRAYAADATVVRDEESAPVRPGQFPPSD